MDHAVRHHWQTAFHSVDSVPTTKEMRLARTGVLVQGECPKLDLLEGPGLRLRHIDEDEHCA
jgi:hypothetical protein